MSLSSALVRVCVCVYVHACVCVHASAHAQSCPILCSLMNCSPPGSFVRGSFQARILEWVAISYPRGLNKLLKNHWLSFIRNSWASLIAQLVKNPPAMQETTVRFLGWEDLLEKGQATHSSILGLPWWLSW